VRIKVPKEGRTKKEEKKEVVENRHSKTYTCHVTDCCRHLLMDNALPIQGSENTGNCGTLQVCKTSRVVRNLALNTSIPILSGEPEPSMPGQPDDPDYEMGWDGMNRIGLVACACACMSRPIFRKVLPADGVKDGCEMDGETRYQGPFSCGSRINWRLKHGGDEEY
jgi:hypothetical protein